MSVPSATYRLQLRGEMTFAAAEALVPYLASLGISHLYLSPITAAMPGSTHGYDVIDFNKIEPALGGQAAFLSLAAALKRHGLKLLVDIVPNHMAASPLNAWWRSVLEWGQQSAHARHFDIDWCAPKLIVPALGKHYAEALAAHDLQIVANAIAGTLEMRYGPIELPLTPPSYATVLASAGLNELALRFATSSQISAEELKTELARVVGEQQQAFARAVAEINADAALLHALHEQQVWRLSHWRMARESLTYRRFFEIADLVGVRVEDPLAFDDAHGLILELVRDGVIDGLRLDHIDGLADPLAYLNRLRAAVGRDDVYIVVEKILGQDEELRSTWPVAGTTGYEFATDVSKMLVAERSEALTAAYAAFTDAETDLAASVLAAKRRVFTRNLAGELESLTDAAHRIAQAEVRTRDFGYDSLRRAIVELASAFPVYRTYVDAAGPGEEDRDVLDRAVARATSEREVEADEAFVLLRDLLTVTGLDPSLQPEALAFATRFQQTSGPLMAKALEDTVFYRYNRLIALNEVGGEPQIVGRPLSEFYAAMAQRLEIAAHALSATATHDTKRGEDARARIYAVSEVPEVWAQCVERWHDMNAELCGGDGNTNVPDRNTEWLYYQALLGAWPPSLSAADVSGLAELAGRMSAFVVKAAREAKVHTSWTNQDDEHETALAAFVNGTLDPAKSEPFLSDFLLSTRPLIAAGVVNSLTQLAIKLLAPGIPDIYQGTELWDLSLVDPDNRRPVDFEARTRALSLDGAGITDLLDRWQTGEIKMAVLEAGLAVRKAFGPQMLNADYVPLQVVGTRADNVVAFARVAGGQIAVLAGARFATEMLMESAGPIIAPSMWTGTQVVLPTAFAKSGLKNEISHEGVDVVDGRIAVESIFKDLSVAILIGS